MTEGFLFNFLYGGEEPKRDARGSHFSLVMTGKTEGWIDIPHGGFSMGLLMDMACRATGTLPPFPWYITFRLGGSKVKIGDEVHFYVVPNERGMEGQGLVRNEELPYMEFTFNPSSSFCPLSPPSIPPLELLTPLPRYRSCLVCGMDRKEPGLKRQFYYSPADLYKYVISPVMPDDLDFYLFSENGTLHSLAIYALLDEILGWAGFMLTASGAVTVSLMISIKRPIHVGERLLFYGRGTRTRGKSGRRLMFWASGGVAALHDGGNMEIVALAEGQYFGLESLTEQMKHHLIPRDLTARAFATAGGEFP